LQNYKNVVREKQFFKCIDKNVLKNNGPNVSSLKLNADATFIFPTARKRLGSEWTLSIHLRGSNKRMDFSDQVWDRYRP